MNVKTEWGVPNQFVITHDNNVYFQSYDTIIAVKTIEGILLDEENWDCSVTTSKYRNRFLNEKTADTRKKIETGEYKLIDLNGINLITLGLFEVKNKKISRIEI